MLIHKKVNYVSITVSIVTHFSPHLHRVNIAKQKDETRQGQKEEDEGIFSEITGHGGFLLSPKIRLYFIQGCWDHFVLSA